jgi:hypothetical protein
MDRPADGGGTEVFQPGLGGANDLICGGRGIVREILLGRHAPAIEREEMRRAAAKLIPQQRAQDALSLPDARSPRTGCRRGWVDGRSIRFRLFRPALEVQIVEDGAVVTFDAAGGLKGEQLLAASRLVERFFTGAGVNGAGREKHQHADDDQRGKVDQKDAARESSGGKFHSEVSILSFAQELSPGAVPGQEGSRGQIAEI